MRQRDAALLNVYVPLHQYLAAHTVTHCTILAFVSHTSARRGSVEYMSAAVSMSSSTHCNTPHHTYICFSFPARQRDAAVLDVYVPLRQYLAAHTTRPGTHSQKFAC